MHGFQNNLAQLLSSRKRSAVLNICSRRLKVKVALEGQIIKWSYIELVRARTCIFIHCYAPSFEEFEGQIGLGLFIRPFIYPPPPISSPPPPKKKNIWILCKKKSLTLAHLPLPSPTPSAKKKSNFKVGFMVKNHLL